MFFYWGILLLFLSINLFIMSLVLLIYNEVFLLIFNLLKVSLMCGDMFLYIDWMGLMFSSVVLYISSFVIIYSSSYMMNDKNKIGFCFLVLLFVLSMIFMIFMPNMWAIMLGWDGLGMVSYCLVIYYQSEISSNAGMITVLSNRVGDVGLLMSIVFMVCFSSWNIFSYMLSTDMMMLVGCMIMLGSITKSAQLPFSAWLPAAMSAPTPVSSLVHSSTLVTAGVYLLIRFSIIFSDIFFSKVLLLLSLFTMIMAGVAAMMEMDMKKIIALSTLGNLGGMMILISFGMYFLAFFYLLTHAIIKAMLFLCAGVMIHGSGGNQDIRYMSMYGKISPFLSLVMTLGCMMLMGMPGMGIYYTKHIMFSYVFLSNFNNLILFLFLLAFITKITYNLRLINYFLGKNCNYAKLINFYEDHIMNSSIFFMGLGSVMMGWLLSWVKFGKVPLIYATYNFSFLSFFFFFFVVFMYLLMYKNWQELGNMGLLMYFFSKMWFFPKISSFFFLSNYLVFRKIYFLLDQGWMEFYGSQGFYKEVDDSMWMMFGFTSKLKTYMLIFIIFIFMYMLF